MSLVYLSYHNENVYDWHNEKGEVVSIPTKYKSIHTNFIKKEKVYDIIDIEPNKKIISTRKPSISLRKTMGCAKIPLKCSQDFLRKNEGIKCIKEKAHICGDFEHRAPVPKREEFKNRSQNQPKNYQKLNIENAKSASTKRPIPKYVDTRNGDINVLCNAGIMPAYIFSPNYGKLPRYLIKLNQQRLQIKGGGNNTPFIENGYDVLPCSKRNELLTGLKSRWIELQKTFQTLPVYTDTLAKQYRKSRLEKVLHQLEEDILLIENNPYIYICN